MMGRKGNDNDEYESSIIRINDREEDEHDLK